jgi:flagellar motor switch/type III secretory pathway protein FliN
MAEETKGLETGLKQWPTSALELPEGTKTAPVVLDEAALALATLGKAMSRERWTIYSEVPARLSVLIPLPNLSLNELLQMKSGTLLVSEWQLSQDVPLLVGDIFLANVSCEPAGERLGVRINGFDQPTHTL